jgi:hypothetical protein
VTDEIITLATLMTGVATPVAVIGAAVITVRGQRAAIEASVAAQSAAANAALKVQQATAQASESARQLILAAKLGNDKIDQSNVKLDQIALTGEKVHTIVNSQNTKLLQVVAAALARIAKENPHDKQAQIDAADAAEAANVKVAADARPPTI